MCQKMSGGFPYQLTAGTFGGTAVNIFRRIKEKIRAFLAWHNSRKMRRARRAAGTVVDTAAAGTGLVLRTTMKVILTVLLVFITTGLLLACIFAVYVKTCLAESLDLTPEEMASNMSSRILVETSAGSNQWEELATLYYTENRLWVEYDQIPEDLEHAAVAIEDQRFYKHKGVDWWRTLGAFGNMFLSMSDTFGGSTITQQLIKNLTGKDEVTVQRKLLEMFRALEFEKRYTKEEIIAWYLNEIYLSEGCYGVGAAAREYFGKEVWQLDLAECASLIGITNNPSLYDPYIGPKSEARNKQRQETILWEMYRQGYITNDEYVAAKNEQLVFKRAVGEHQETVPNTYYIDSLIWQLTKDLAAAKGITENAAEFLIYNRGYDIYCCMDKRVQGIIDDIYQNTGNLPQPWRNTSGQKLSSAIVVMDPQDGSVLGLAGDTGTKTGSFTNNWATELPRPPGSSFKPVAVYGPAFDLGLITQTTPVNDSPNIVLSNSPNWYPRNDGGTYRGWTTIRQGIISSLNTVAAQTLNKMGLAASWDYLTNRFRFKNLVRDYYDPDQQRTFTDYAYAPLALGQLSYGITPLEMAQAYTAFANDGIMVEGRLYAYVWDSEGNIVLENAPERHVAVKQNTAWNIANVLQGAVEGGTGTEARIYGQAVAGKTGTTSNKYDRYFTGFTRYYVAACWTGYEYNAVMDFYGNPAAQIWQKVMSRLHEGLGYWAFPTPTIGAATNAFGKGGNSPSPSVSPTSEAPPTPDITQEPAPTGGEAPPTSDPGGTTTPPEYTAPPAESAPPSATDVPVTTDPPAQETTPPTDAPPTDAPATEAPPPPQQTEAPPVQDLPSPTPQEAAPVPG